MGQNKAAALASNLKPKSLDSSSPVHRWYMARFLLYNHRHFPNVYLPLRLVLLLNGVWRDWIALEVPERAGGAGVLFFFHNSYSRLVSFPVFILFFSFYLTRWYSPWRWWALSFSSFICLIWPCYIHTYFCYYLYAYYYISVREKYGFVLKIIWIPGACHFWLWSIRALCCLLSSCWSDLHSSKFSSSIPQVSFWQTDWKCQHSSGPFSGEYILRTCLSIHPWTLTRLTREVHQGHFFLGITIFRTSPVHRKCLLYLAFHKLTYA